MESTLRLVRCPCCLAPLYTLATIAPSGAQGWELTPDSPRVELDKDGPYMRCKHCSRRIALLRERAVGAPGFEVAAKQKCDRVLR